jgi:uncharacterized Ntn-hydrolase superfamily protein
VTYSIVARDPQTGDFGIAVQSKFLAVGAVVPWARAGVGAIATQAFANVAYGPQGLDLLADGHAADEVMRRLVAADDGREHRQVGVVDAQGRSATHTGRDCFAWAGGRTGENFAAQGNILADAPVVDGLVDTFLAGGPPFPELLVACLAAAEEAGGDRRGRESASLLVVREAGGFGGGNDRWIDMRVDQHDDPIGELARVLAFQRLYYDRPDAADLVPLDEGTATEVRSLLAALGGGPGGRFGTVYRRMSGEPAQEDDPHPAVGEPRPFPSNWNDDWQRALVEWMDVANLEARIAAPGWVDPRVIEILRSAQGGG